MTAAHGNAVVAQNCVTVNTMMYSATALSTLRLPATKTRHDWTTFAAEHLFACHTNIHKLAIFARRLLATRTQYDWTTFEAEQLLIGSTNICVTALIACEFLQAILVHPIHSFAALADELTALGTIRMFI
jgi:hypothetical protein